MFFFISFNFNFWLSYFLILFRANILVFFKEFIDSDDNNVAFLDAPSDNPKVVLNSKAPLIIDESVCPFLKFDFMSSNFKIFSFQGSLENNSNSTPMVLWTLIKVMSFKISIAQAMWDSYQEIISTRSEAEHINQYLYNNIEHPYITRLLGNTDQDYIEDSELNMGDDNEESYDKEGDADEGDADDDRSEGWWHIVG